MRRSWFVRTLTCTLMVAALVALVGGAVMLLWNLLMPSLFALPALSFTQAVGLLILGRILFGGLRGSRMGWRHDLYERWESMTPDDRQRLRSGLRRRCGPWGSRPDK